MLYGDDVPAGAFGGWKTGTTGKCCGQSAKTLTATDRRTLRERIGAARAAADAERTRQHADAAASARRIWARSPDADARNGYCQLKGVKPYGLKLANDGDRLLVPLYNPAGKLVNLQFSYPKGGKRFKAGGEVSGCCYQFGGELRDGDVLMIGEGYATCASAHAATDFNDLQQHARSEAVAACIAVALDGHGTTSNALAAPATATTTITQANGSGEPNAASEPDGDAEQADHRDDEATPCWRHCRPWSTTAFAVARRSAWPSKVAPFIAAELGTDIDRVAALLGEYAYQQLAELAGPQPDFANG